MRAQVMDKITAERGYVSAAHRLGLTQAGILAPGSQNLLMMGLDRIEAFKGLANPLTGGRVMFNFSNTFASLNDYSAITAKGSIFMLGAGRTLGLLGAGQAYLTGASLGLAASSTLQYLLYRNGVYAGAAANGPFQAGRAAPSAPSITPMASTLSTPGKVSGAVAVKLTRVSSSTGGESNASTSSPIVIASAQSIRIGPFPAVDSNGQDRWGIYATLAGFGLRGPFYFFKEIAETDLVTIDGIARCYEAEWTDADLSATALLAPLDNYPPPAGVFACELGGVVAIIGCYGDVAQGVSTQQPGNAIACSLEGFPEAFPPSADYLLYLPEPPLFVISRAADGYVFIFCENSTHVLSYTGGTPPLKLDTLLPTTGIVAPHNAAIVDGRLYLMTGRGLVRAGGLGGEIETEWAQNVIEPLAFDPATTVLGYDSNTKQLCVCNGSTVLTFNVAREVWGAPVYLNSAPVSVAGSVVSTVTLLGQLKLCVNNAGVFTLYDFNKGVSGSTWIAKSGWMDASAPLFLKTLTTVRCAVRHDNLAQPNITTRIYRVRQKGSVYGADLAKEFTDSISFPGLQTLKPPALNVREVKAYALWQSAQGFDSAPVEMLVEGTVSRMRV